MESLRMVMPMSGGNASRYRPVQDINGRVVRECCQDGGSESLVVFLFVIKRLLY